MQKKWFLVPAAIVGGLFGTSAFRKMNAKRGDDGVESHNARFPWRTALDIERIRAYFNLHK